MNTKVGRCIDTTGKTIYIAMRWGRGEAGYRAGLSSRRPRVQVPSLPLWPLPYGRGFFYRAVAQGLARSVRDREVGGSNPLSPTYVQRERTAPSLHFCKVGAASRLPLSPTYAFLAEGRPARWEPLRVFHSARPMFRGSKSSLFAFLQGGSRFASSTQPELCSGGAKSSLFAFLRDGRLFGAGGRYFSPFPGTCYPEPCDSGISF